MKDHYKYNKIILQDNSYKKCHDFNIELCKMYTLMYGDTWYGKYGFLPAKDYSIDKIKFKKYEKNKSIMGNIKMKDFPELKQYLENSFESVKNAGNIIANKKMIMKLYDKYYQKNILLKNFIKIFLEDYDKSCLLFYSFYESLYDDLGLADFYKQSYIKQI